MSKQGNDMSIPCITYLSSDMKLKPHYTPALMAEATKRCIARGLRWDNRFGRLHDNDGELTRFSVQSDFVPHTSVADVARWEFSGHVNNEAWHCLIGQCGSLEAALHCQHAYELNPRLFA